MLFGLKRKEQCLVIRTAQTGKPFSECPIQSDGARMLYDSLKMDMEKHPGVVFDMPELDDDDPEMDELAEIMFEGIPLDE